ncbi:MAG: nitroreductase family protein [Acidimicrobiales bacterium]
METWDAIQARRNVRQYQDRAIPAEQLDHILEAGRRAPSSRNWQPWDFILVTDRAELQRLAEVWQGAKHIATSAATIAVIAPSPKDDFQRTWTPYDLGQATAMMMLAAADLGIGSGHSAVGDQALARRLLGFPADRYLGYLIGLGYPADRPLRPIAHPNRRPFDEVVHRGRW